MAGASLWASLLLCLLQVALGKIRGTPEHSEGAGVSGLSALRRGVPLPRGGRNKSRFHTHIQLRMTWGKGMPQEAAESAGIVKVANRTLFPARALAFGKVGWACPVPDPGPLTFIRTVSSFI